MELLSDEISGNLFENVYSDETRLFEPRVVFKDRTLLNHITKKFPAGFRDFKLEDKVMKFWADRNLPKSNISLDTNTVKLSVESLSKIKLDPAFISKIEQLEGSTYATGNLIPEAFSILFIPATVKGKRFTVRSYTSSGIIFFGVCIFQTS